MALAGQNALSKLLKLRPDTNPKSKAELMAGVVSASKKNPFHSTRQIHETAHFADVVIQLGLAPPQPREGCHAPKPSYSAGDWIQGQISLNNGKQGAIRLQGVKVALVGTAGTKFKEQGEVHTKSQTCLDEGVYVHGTAWPGKMVRILPGTHTYSFRLQLPPASETQLPSTFKSDFGVVTYSVVVCLDTDMQYLKKCERKIRVAGVLLLDPRTRSELIRAEKTKRHGSRYSFSCPSFVLVHRPELEFDMRIDYPAEEGAQAPTTGTVSLILKTTYHGGSVSRAWKDTHTVLGQVTNEDVRNSWKGVLLMGDGSGGPPRPTFTSSGARAVIEFKYLLRVSLAEADGGKVLFKLERPITVGTSFTGEESSAPPETLQLQSSGGNRGGFLLAPPDTTSVAGRRSSSSSSFNLNQIQPNPEREASDTEGGGEPQTLQGGGMGGRRSSLPSYSMLNLRSESTETAPPDYDELE